MLHLPNKRYAQHGPIPEEPDEEFLHFIQSPTFDSEIQVSSNLHEQWID